MDCGDARSLFWRVGRRPMVGIAVVLFGACSGGGSAGGDAGTVVRTAPPPLDTRVVTTTTVVPATASTATTVVVTATSQDVSTSAVSAATIPLGGPSVDGTMSPEETEEVFAILDAVDEAWASFNEALQDPTNPEKIERVKAANTGATLERALAVLEQYQAENLREVTNSDLPASIQVDPTRIRFDLDAGVATVEYCFLNSNVLVETGGNPDGTDKVLDPDVRSVRSQTVVTRIDGQWVKSDGKQLAVVPGETCES